METVLITGAARGIGLELTRQFLDLGYKVISTYRNQPSTALVELAESSNLSLVELEVTDSQAIENVASTLSDTPIDILINNAGVIGPDSQSRDTVEAEQWMHTLAVNTIAPLMISRAFIPQLKLSINPRIVTISSQMGLLSRNSTGMYAYRSSKAAINKVMQVLAVELKPEGIAVCPIHPGWVQTDMGGQSADISPQESATGIVKFARGLTMSQSGKFFTWEGEEQDW